MELGLKDKSIIVTAASGGLGFSIAKMFVEEGANVCLSGGTGTCRRRGAAFERNVPRQCKRLRLRCYRSVSVYRND